MNIQTEKFNPKDIEEGRKFLKDTLNNLLEELDSVNIYCSNEGCNELVYDNYITNYGANNYCSEKCLHANMAEEVFLANNDEDPEKCYYSIEEFFPNNIYAINTIQDSFHDIGLNITKAPPIENYLDLMEQKEGWEYTKKLLEDTISDIALDNEIRICHHCNAIMTSGYCINGGASYYCSDECLHKNMAEEDFLELHEDEKGETYHTILECHSRPALYAILSMLDQLNKETDLDIKPTPF